MTWMKPGYPSIPILIGKLPCRQNKTVNLHDNMHIYINICVYIYIFRFRYVIFKIQFAHMYVYIYIDMG